ncbi:response regulator [uncultured Chitinophaga sp.]|jgi:Response regulators consisting of a CheY-like receiver domain and a winged-helix DNA-binding domain|uniref:response regulator n=1 Tax=uncultured Chitinophaga sp. TaxID=339340 RepID=UPI00262137C4|nr:response regulator transcription factor [uncultured Chitinophaga sp.]
MPRILLIEDDPIERYVLTTYLRRYCTAEVITATGEDCIRYISTMPSVDMAIMDWCIVPGHNGAPVIQSIRNADPHAKIVVYTSSLEKSDEITALHAGADKFLKKTGNMEELRSYISRLQLSNSQVQIPE